MTKHKLDEVTEDILRHYGIKGMRWDVRRTPEQIAAAGEDGMGGGAADVDEESEEDNDEGLLDKLGDKMDDLVDSMETKIGDIKDSIRAKGAKFMAMLNGGDIKYDAEYSKKMGKAMKKAHEKEKQYAKDNKKSASVRRAEKSFAKMEKKRKAKYDKHLKPQMDDLSKKLESQGYKKHEKSNKSLKEMGYSGKAVSGKSGDKEIARLTKGLKQHK